MKKKRRGKRKSRTELYRLASAARTAKAYMFVARIFNVVPGGNPFGLGEYTITAARGPERA